MPLRTPPLRLRAIAALAVLAVCAGAAACGGEGGGPPRSGAASRPFLMGFSSLPRELNAQSYAGAIEFAADHGDLVLIQREMPWPEFLPGSSISEDLARTTGSERDAVRDRGLHLFFAIDLTDGATGRDRPVALPPDLAGRRFDDPDLRAAVISYAEYVAINYHPHYLALGVEMNLYYEEAPADFDNFLSLYDEAYAAVKARSPDTLVTVTLQYEDLQGVLPRDDPHFADWHLVDVLEPRVDFIAISTYPSLAYASAAQIPGNYYTRLRAFTDRPIVIAEMGYASAPGPQGATSGTEEDQAQFLERVLREAGDIAMPFVVWFAIWDPAYAAGTPFTAFQHIGLRRTDDTPKPAWTSWDENARRPYAPG